MKTLTKRQLIANDAILDTLEDALANAGMDVLFDPEQYDADELKVEWREYLRQIRLIKRIASRLKVPE